MNRILLIIFILSSINLTAQTYLDSLSMIVPGKIEESSITRIEFSPNEKYFLINDGNVNCRIYDVISGKEIYKINSGLMNLDQDCQFHFLSNEAIYYLIKTNSPQIRVWNILDNTSKVLYKNVIVSGNGIVIIENNDSNQVIDIKSRKVLNEYKIPSEWLIDFVKKQEDKFKGERIIWTPTKNPFLLYIGYRRFIKKKFFDDVDTDIWEVRNLLNGETYKIDEKITDNLHLEPANSIGDIVAKRLSNNVSIVSLRTSKELFSIKGEYVGFSPDGTFVITSLKNGFFKVYETYTGKLVSVFEEHKNKENSKILYISNKNEVWSVDSDTNLISWQINNLDKIKKLKMPLNKEKIWSNSFNKLSFSQEYFSNSGKYFCRLNEDATIEIFRQTDAKPISKVSHHIVDNSIEVNNEKSHVLIKNHNKLNYFDCYSPNINYFINEHLYRINDFQISKSNKLIVSLSINMENELTGNALVISNLGFDSLFIGHTCEKIRMNDNILHTDLRITHDDRFIILCEPHTLKIWNPLNGKLIHQEKIPFNFRHVFIIHPKQNILYLVAEKEILVFDIESLKFKKKIKIGFDIDDLVITESGDKLLIVSMDKKNIYIIYDIIKETMKINRNHSVLPRFIKFNLKGDKVISIGDYKELIISDSDSLTILSSCPLEESSDEAEFNPSNDSFFLTRSIEYNSSNYCLEDFWDLEDILNTSLSESHYIQNGEVIISVSTDRLHLYFTKTDLKKAIYERIQLENNNWLVKLPNSPYYMCSKDASKMLHYVTPSLKVIGFEQLDPVYNRPDIVLDSIGKYFGNSDGGMIDEYRKSWEKRIDRLGLDKLDKEKLGKGEIAVPNAEIVGADLITPENKDGKLEIKVAANDPKYLLRRFNVYVNEVPLYGSAGISIAHLKKQVWDTTVSVPLSVGENKIQVSVMNELVLENFKYPCYVNYTPSEPIVAKTYYIGIGVNEFKEPGHKLNYCVKDVTDLSTSFGGPNTEVKLFTNAQVTKENILALKDYLSKTTVNDKVIISCSSHGLLDDSLNFYLAMHDVDFNNPKKRGLKYEELENLLDGIPARQKLLLLDACNSGENDKTELLNIELAQAEKQVETPDIAELKTKIKGGKMQLVKENKSNFKKMNELFVNVRNNTGSLIISAAGGQESALEAITVDGKSIENGAFSYCVLEYLKNNSNKPEELTVNKLKNYVEKRVEEITNGKQQPTSRQETMEVDWRVR